MKIVVRASNVISFASFNQLCNSTTLVLI